MKTTLFRLITCLMLLFALPAYADTAPEHLYLVGNVNGFNGDPATGGQVVEFHKSGNVFTLNSVEIGKYNSFDYGAVRLSTTNVFDEATKYGCPDHLDYGWPKDEKLPCTIKIAKKSSRLSTIYMALGTYSITVDFSKMTMTISEPKETPNPVDNLYLHGNCGETGADGEACIKFVKTGDKTFECKNVDVVSKIGYSYGSLWISTAGEGAKASTSECYYPSVDYSTATGESSITLIPASSTDPKTFKCKPGTFDIAVNLESMTMTVTEIKKEPEPVNQLYLHGNCGETGETGNGLVEFVKTADDIFECKNVEIVEKTGLSYGELWISPAGKDAQLSENNCYYPTVDYTTATGESPITLVPANSTDPKTFRCKPGTFDIAVNLETMTMTVTEIKKEPEPVNQLYLHGNCGEAGATGEGYVEFEKTAENIFECKSVEIVAKEGESYAELWISPSGKDAQLSESNCYYPAADYTATTGESQITLIPANSTDRKVFKFKPGTFDISVNLESMTMAVTEIKKEPEPVNQLYLHGNCGETGASGNGLVEFVKTADDIFECKNVEIVEKTGLSYGELWISPAGKDAQLSENNCYYPSADYTTATGESPITLIPANSTDRKVFKFKPGTFDITVNLESMTMTVTEIKKEPEPVNQLYLHGNCGETGASGNGLVEFVKTADNIFECKNVEIIEKNGLSYGELWISPAGKDAQLSESNCYYPSADYTTATGESPITLIPANSTDRKVFKFKPGTFDITVNLKTMTMTVTEIKKEPEPVNQLYLHGNCGEKGNGYIEFTKTAENIFECKSVEIVAKEGESYAELWISPSGKDAQISESNCYYPSADYTTATGESSITLIPANSTDRKVFKFKPGTFDITVNLESMTMNVTEIKKEPEPINQLYLHGNCGEAGATGEGYVEFEKTSENIFECKSVDIVAKEGESYAELWISPAGEEAELSESSCYYPSADYTVKDGESPITLIPASSTEAKVFRCKPGSYDITVDLNEPAKITLTKTVETAIDNITVTSEEETVYYNLQGVKVVNPTKGYYIVRKGAKAFKVRID